MLIRKLSAATVAAALMVSPIAAQAAPAARAAAPAAESNELGSAFGIDLWIFVVIAVAIGVWAVADHNDDPSSP